MARASYIYIVCNADARDFEIQAAFTVKHECGTWIERKVADGTLVPHETDWHVVRVPDGLFNRPDSSTFYEGAPTVWEFFNWPKT